MKILILGSGSFAGQAVFSNLLKEGFEVFGINRSKPKNKYFWPWLENYNIKIGDNWHEANINKDPNKLIKLIQEINPSHIVDFMGQGMVAQSWEDPMLWYKTNIENKTYILETIRSLNNLQKYVRASTPEVYGSNYKSIKENDSFNPSTPYAVSHCAIDYHIRCLGRNYDFPYSIGRFANFYGEGQQLYRVIPKAILKFLNKEKFKIDGDGKSLRSFIYSRDIVNAIKKLLFKANPISEYNFSSNQEISIKELITLITKLTNVDFDEFVEFGPDRNGKDLIYRLDCSKAKKELSWENKTSLKDGLEKVNHWISSNLNNLNNESFEYLHKV